MGYGGRPMDAVHWLGAHEQTKWMAPYASDATGKPRGI